MISSTTHAALFCEEAALDPSIPPAYFMDERFGIQEKMAWLSFAKTRGLTQRSQTPNFVAMEKLLIARYGVLTDDITHEDFSTGI